MKPYFLFMLAGMLNWPGLMGKLLAELPYPPPNVDVNYIKFNYTSGYANDALAIKLNNSTPVPVPEWASGGSVNYASVYIKSQSSRKITAQFYVSLSGYQTMYIYATVSGNGIGSVNGANVNFNYSQYSEAKIMIFNGSVPGSVGKRNYTLSWHVDVVNGHELEEPFWIGDTGPHNDYALLAAPQSPMSVPWTIMPVFWASGQTGTTGAANQVVQHIYNDLGLMYDIYYGAPGYTSYGSGVFYLTQFLSDVPGTIVNCYDCGKAVKIFANALGCGASYQYSNPFGYVNCIKPVGRGWTNNPFYGSQSYPYNQPIVGEDDAGRTSFGNHAFGTLSSSIYDACLKVDTDGNPDYGPPFTENWATGWSWSTYKSKVVDNNPPTATGNPQLFDFNVE